MPYATSTDMVESFGSAEMRQLTDIELPRQNAVNATVMARALGNASDLIDGYLVGRYAVPVATPPSALRVHCCGMARYLLMTSMPDERAKTDFANALSYLKSVAAGTVALLPPAQAEVPAGVGPLMFSAGQKIFAREGG